MNMERLYTVILKEQKLQGGLAVDSKKYAEAIQFAAMAHEGNYRKGTKVPYIAHVVETGLIAMSLTDDEDTVVAAILHDIVEDTSYELIDIEKRFGSKVAELVSYESEDKMHDISPESSWKTRKEAFLDNLQKAPLEAKVICLSDKLSNIRMSVKMHSEKGDDMWLAFNQKDKKEQEWYYRSIYAKLPELKDTDAFKEYVQCCDDVFGKQCFEDLTCRYYQDSNKVMYESFISDRSRVNGLIDFVTDELKNISHFFVDQQMARDLVEPYVFLSDEIFENSFGKLSDLEVIDALEKYSKTMKRTDMQDYFLKIIQAIIQILEIDIKENEEHRELEQSWLKLIPTMAEMERITALEGTEEDKEILSDIIEILSMRKVEKELRLGEYLPDRHQIIIYYAAIEQKINQVVKPKMDFYAKLSSVLAHEYFHAMHYAMAPKHVLWNNSSYKSVKGYQKREIREALADFYSVLWCYDQAKQENELIFMNVAIERFESWRKHLYSAWPYSKAIYLMKDDTKKLLPISLDDKAIRNGYNSLLPVLETSIRDIERSYELLRW